MVPITDLDGDLFDGEYDPSSETPMHTHIYAERENIGGIRRRDDDGALHPDRGR